MKAASDSRQSDDSNTGVLKYLTLKLPSQHASTLKQMIDDATLAKTRKGTSTIKVKARRNVYHKFGYRFTPISGTTLPRSFSQSSTSSPSLSRFASQVYKGTHPQELHSLNTKTLHYIQQRFGLVASLLQLLCQVESSESKPPPSTAEDEEMKPTKGPSLFKALKGQTPTKESKGKRSPESKRAKKWCDSYTELLECYIQFPPLKAYIESRISPFEDVLHFYLSENKNKTREHRAKHPLISDVGLAFAHTEVLRSATSYGLQKHTRNRKFSKALEMLSSEPLANCTEDSFLVSLKQTILRMVYLYFLKKEETFNPLSLLARLDDPGLCARLALQSLRHWPITTCIDVLSMCSGRLHMNPTLLNVVNRELKKMRNYHEVCVCVCVSTRLCLCVHVYMLLATVKLLIHTR